MPCECIIQSKIAQFSVKIVCSDIVKSTIENCTITAKFNNVCYDIDPKVNTGIGINLLEQILTLLGRLRTFSFAKAQSRKETI